MKDISLVQSARFHELMSREYEQEKQSFVLLHFEMPSEEASDEESDRVLQKLYSTSSSYLQQGTLVIIEQHKTDQTSQKYILAEKADLKHFFLVLSKQKRQISL